MSRVNIATWLPSLFALIGTLAGTFGGILTGSRLTTYRLEQLEKKVEKHNTLVERTYRLEGKVSELERETESLHSAMAAPHGGY